MSKLKDHKIFIIRHKETGKHWTAPSGKSSWRAAGHAKNAWATMCGYFGEAEAAAIKYDITLVPYVDWRGNVDTKTMVVPYFDDQDKYEIVEVNSVAQELVGELQALIKALIPCLPEDKQPEFLQRYKEITNDK